MRPGHAFALFASILAPAAAAQPSSIGEQARQIPSDYLACASDYWRSLLRGAEAAGRYSCTEAYVATIPDHAGGTLQMREARAEAIRVADLYIEDVVVAGLGERLRTDVDSRGDHVMAKSRLLDAAVGLVRLYDEALCGLVEEAFGPGTFRNVASANCRIRNRDRLIEDLLRARIDITQGIGEDRDSPGPRPIE